METSGRIEETASTDAQKAPLRVLVVDDNVDLARGCAWLLRLVGHDVQTAFDGREGLDLARAFRPHAALLDIGLPGLDGYQLARSIREQLGPDVLLIAITAYGQDEHVDLAREAGFDYHLVKPANLTQLLAVLDGSARIGPSRWIRNFTSFSDNQTPVACPEQSASQI
jgi:DNA-binding response OmpR family regulator